MNLSDRLSRLSPAKRALLLQKLREDAAQNEARSAIPKRPQDAPPVLSFAQERLWFLDQLDPNSAIYNVPTAVRLTGQVDVAALQQSLNMIVQRHEVLRATFSTVDGRAVQTILPTVALDVPVVDVRDVPEASRERQAQALLLEQARLPFDLATGPLLRVALVRLGDEEYMLLLTMHHIVSDGWSLSVFVREMATVYEALTTTQQHGSGPPLPELPLQYPDFAAWQRQWLAGHAQGEAPGVLEQQLSFWKQQLSDAPTFLELPTDRPRPAIQSTHGTTTGFLLPSSLQQALTALSQQEDVTLFMTLLAAFQVLLARYSGQERISVGTPVAGRSRFELESLIGFFVNTLVIHTDLSGNPSFRDLLQRVRSRTIGAYEHQDLPFEQLVDALQLERDMRHHPLFQVMFVLQNAPLPVLHLPNVTLTPVEIDNGTAKFDVTLIVAQSEQGLVCEVEYNTDLFDAGTIARMVEHYQLLLEQMVAHPEAVIDSYSLVRPSDRALLPDPTQSLDVPSFPPITSVMSAWAQRLPQQTALSQGTIHWTYQELVERSQAIAYGLQTLGVEQGAVVAVAGERSCGLIASMLAVLMSGGVLLTLEPRLPVERQQLMLREARAEHQIFVERQSAQDEPTHEPRSVLRVHPATGAIITPHVAPHTPVPALREPLPHEPAYLFFTSGTTGVPKGVLGNHQGLAHFLSWQREQFGIGTSDRAAQLTGLSFDVVLRDIFLPLTSGATLCLPPDIDNLAPDTLLPWMDAQRISIVHTVPALAQAWLSQIPLNVSLRNLRWIFFAGEPLSAALVQRWREAFPATQGIVNLYGPTETTLAKCWYQVPDAPLPGIQPIGRPIPQAQALLLRDRKQLCGIGEPGEIVIRTPFRTYGYVNADQEQSRFAPNPFRDDASDLVYFTGDRGRYRADGTLEILGRLDQQVKVNGVRIEPGEVEAALLQHPAVQAVAVVAREEPATGDQPVEHLAKRLVAYIVPQPTRSPMAAGGKRYLLPNNLAVAHLNKNETDYLYREIFELQAYIRHGITLKDGDTVFDVGANIGLFMAFANQICHQPKVYSFDPNPIVFELLRANAQLYGSDVQLFNIGLADTAKTATFTFFPGFAMLSGFYTDAEVEQEVIKNYVRNQQRDTLPGSPELIDQVTGLLEERFAGQSFNATLDTLSDVMAREQIAQIDLLKINVEKSELDVLRGVRDEDWPKITQIVMEVDVHEHIAPITSLLDRHGYEYVVFQDQLLTNTDLCYIYAARRDGDRRLINPEQPGSHLRDLPPLPDPDLLTPAELREFMSQRVPREMIPAQVVFLESLPLTPNGKIDRRALPTPDLQAQQFDTVFVAPRTEVEQILARVWQEVLGVKEIGIASNFFELGGDSILAIQMIARANQAGLALTPKQLFQHQTIADLAAIAGPVARRADQTSVQGHVPLLPIQHWFFAQPPAEPHQSVRAVLLDVAATTDHATVAQALQQVVVHHDALRARFIRSETGWQQEFAPPSAVPLTVVSLAGLPEVERGAAIERTAAQVQAAFDLSGPLFQAVWLEGAPDAPRQMLLMAHELIIDQPSWTLVIADLQSAYLQLRAGTAVSLPAKTLSLRQWSELLHSYAHTPELEDEAAEWRQLAGDDQWLPEDRAAEFAPSLGGARIMTGLSAEETRALLTDVPHAYNTDLTDAIGAALAQALTSWTQRASIVIDVEQDARPGSFADADINRTVGRCTALFPIRLIPGADGDPGSMIKAIKEQFRAIPRRGSGYGVLRYLAAPPEQPLPQSRVCLICDGAHDLLPEATPLFPAAYPAEQLAQLAPELHGYLLRIQARIVGGRLHMTLDYDAAMYAPTTIDALARATMEQLRAIVAHCQSPAVGGYTPSDFPQLNINQADLDQLLGELGQL